MTASETALVQRLIDDLIEARATAAAAVERLRWLQAVAPDTARPIAPVLRLARFPSTS